MAMRGPKTIVGNRSFCSTLQWRDAAFEFAAKRSQVGLHGLNLGFETLDPRLEIPESPFHTAEAAAHLAAQRVGLVLQQDNVRANSHNFAVQCRGVLAICCNLERDNVEELQNLLGGQFKLYQPRALQNVPARA